MWVNLAGSVCFLVFSLAGTFGYQVWAARSTGDFGTDVARMERVIDTKPRLAWFMPGKLGEYVVNAGDAPARQGGFREAIERYGYLLSRRARHREDTGYEDCAAQRLANLPFGMYTYGQRLMREHQYAQARETFEEFRTLFPDAPPDLSQQVSKRHDESWLEEILYLRSCHMYQSALTKIRDLPSAGAPPEAIAHAHGVILATTEERLDSLLAKHRIGAAYDSLDETFGMFLGDMGIKRGVKSLYRRVASEVFHVSIAGRPPLTVVPPDPIGDSELPGQARLDVTNAGAAIAVVSFAPADRFGEPRKIEVKPDQTATLVLPAGFYWQLCCYRGQSGANGQLGRLDLRAARYVQTIGGG